MPADLFPEQKLPVGVGVASWQTVPWLSDSTAPAGTALPRALLALQSSWGMRARSTGEQRMWVTAGSPPAGMLRERLQGECIREQLQFFPGLLAGNILWAPGEERLLGLQQPWWGASCGVLLLLRVGRNMCFRWLSGRAGSELNGLSSRSLSLIPVLNMILWLLFNQFDKHKKLPFPPLSCLLS